MQRLECEVSLEKLLAELEGDLAQVLELVYSGKAAVVGVRHAVEDRMAPIVSTTTRSRAEGSSWFAAAGLAR